MRSTRHIYDGLVNIVAYARAAAAATPAGEALGLARVTAIEPCPPGDAAAGLWAATPGFLVSARVSRTVDEVLAITLSCAFDPIIATPDHRFYSETRSAWVPAGELRPGERLRARWGPCWITSIERRRGPTRVCDLTVAGVHAFYVGEGGVAGHNGGKCGESPGELRTKYLKEGYRPSRIGGSGKLRPTLWHYPTRKEAKEAARRAAGRGGSVIRDHGHKGNRAHWHPVDRKGTRLPDRKNGHYFPNVIGPEGIPGAYEEPTFGAAPEDIITPMDRLAGPLEWLAPACR